MKRNVRALGRVICNLPPVLLWALIFSQLRNAALGNFTFAVIPKSLNNPFYNATKDGCMDAARVLGVICFWTAPEQEDPELQANVTLDLIRRRTVDGIAVSVVSSEFMAPVIAESMQAGIPVVTFDSDAPGSERSVYVGTDNNFFGDELGKVLNNLQPNGGTFAVVAGTAPNLQARVRGLLKYLNEIGIWKQLLNSPSDFGGDPLTAIEQMKEFAKQNPTAVVSVMGAPMRSGKWEEFVNEENPLRNITLVCGDAMPNQLAFLDRVMMVANWQAFEARAIQSEFSESKYLAVAIASMLQAAFIGVPTLFVVRKSPEAFYLILTFMLFVISMAVLMLIFVPKIVIHQNFQRLSPAEQRRLIRNSIQRSQTLMGTLGQSELVVGLPVGAFEQLAQMRNDLSVDDECEGKNEDSMLVIDTSHQEFRNGDMDSSTFRNGDDSPQQRALSIVDPTSKDESRSVPEEWSQADCSDQNCSYRSRRKRRRC